MAYTMIFKPFPLALVKLMYSTTVKARFYDIVQCQTYGPRTFEL